jgi:hypothetical protein
VPGGVTMEEPCGDLQAAEALLRASLIRTKAAGVRLVYAHNAIFGHDGKLAGCCALAALLFTRGLLLNADKPRSFTGLARDGAKILGVNMVAAKKIAAGWDGQDARDCPWRALGLRLHDQFMPAFSVST